MQQSSLYTEIKKGQLKLQEHILNHINKFPDKIEDKKMLQRFLGCLTYAEAWIYKLAEMRKPLQSKLKDKVIIPSTISYERVRIGPHRPHNICH